MKLKLYPPCPHTPREKRVPRGNAKAAPPPPYMVESEVSAFMGVKKYPIPKERIMGGKKGMENPAEKSAPKPTV